MALLLVLASTMIVLHSTTAAAAVECSGPTCTETFAVQGAIQQFTVPDGVTSVAATVAGAQGGASIQGVPGGEGAVVSGTIALEGGQKLFLLVGAAGTTGGGPAFGGGGESAALGETFGTGGGGSFIFGADEEPLLVAGGGGGSGTGEGSLNGVPFPANVGGSGASFSGIGGPGLGAFYPEGQVLATGGSATAAGRAGQDLYGSELNVGGDGSGPAAHNSPGRGGNGAPLNPIDFSGAGGGGGYYGGGGGGLDQSGAGGGSFYDPATVSAPSSTQGGHTGPGSVTLSWTRRSPTLSVSLSPAAPRVGQTVIVESTIGAAGPGDGTFETLVDGTTECAAWSAPSCAVAGLAPGEHVVEVRYSGDASYEPASTQRSFEISFPPLGLIVSTPPDARVADPYSFAPYADGGDPPYEWSISGLPPGLSSSASGAITGTPSAAGTYEVIVSVSDSRPVPEREAASFPLVVDKALQSVSIDTPPPSHASVGGSLELTATALPPRGVPTFRIEPSTTDEACSLVGSELHLDHAGTCLVGAELAGDTNHESARGQLEFRVYPAEQTISFPAIEDRVFGDPDFALDATSGSGLPVIYSVSTAGVCGVSVTTVHLLSTGGCTVIAEQPGDADHLAATPVERTFTVHAMPQSLSFPQPAELHLGEGDLDPGATASSGLPVDYVTETPSACTIAAGLIHPVGAGECTLVAEQPGDTFYEPATARRSVQVAPAAPSLTLSASGGTLASGQSVTLIATMSGAFSPTGPVVFEDNGHPLGMATLDETGRATLTTTLGSGTHALTARYAGDHDNLAAAAGPTTVNVAERPSEVGAGTGAVAPRVVIWHSPETPHRADRAGDPHWTFVFADESPTATFYCRLDKKPFRQCGSRVVYRHLTPGPHIFRVKSIDAAGDESAVETIRFLAGHRHRGN
jgi:hypothetical protein